MDEGIEPSVAAAPIRAQLYPIGLAALHHSGVSFHSVRGRQIQGRAPQQVGLGQEVGICSQVSASRFFPYISLYFFVCLLLLLYL